MAKKTKITPSVLAAKMFDIKVEMDKLKSLYDVMSKELLAALQKEGKMREGNFVRATKKTLQITDTAAALEWAKEHNVMDINTYKAMTVIKKELKVPDGFAVKVTEYLTSAVSRK